MSRAIGWAAELSAAFFFAEWIFVLFFPILVLMQRTAYLDSTTFELTVL